MSQELSPPAVALEAAPPAASRLRAFLRYCRRNPPLVVGILLLLLIVAFVLVGSIKTDPTDAKPLSYRPSQPPSAEHWLGTDRLGKDILAVMVEGTPKTIRIGLIAGTIGVVIGTLLAFFSGYYGGWFDTFSQGTIDSWSIRQKQGGQGARGRQWLVMGPWGHGTEYNRKQGEIEFPENAIKPPDYPYPMFMDHFVLGTDTGLLERPFVTYYRMGAIAEEGAPGNDWQFADDWPVPHSVASYYLHADGSLSTQAPLEPETMQWSFDPSDPTPTVGGRNLYEPKGMFDQRSIEGRSDNLLFTTDPLAQPLEVTGRVLANLFIASDAVDTDVAVRLSDVYPDGRSILVLDGILRLRYRNGFSEAVLLVPDERTEVEVDLWSTSYVFNSGHRIRLALTSSNHARWDLNPGTGEVWVDGGEYVVQENTVYFGPQQASALLLPVVQ